MQKIFSREQFPLKLRKLFFHLLFSALLIAGFFPGTVQGGTPFEEFRKDFLKAYWKIHPIDAVYSGFHENDSVLTVFNKDFFAFERKELLRLKNQSKTVNPDGLQPSDRIDFFMMRDKLESDLWYLDSFKSYEWNPAWYNIGGEFAQILASTNTSLSGKLKIISLRLRNADKYFEAAKNNLVRPVAEHIDLAIIQNEGSLEIFEKQIPDSVNRAGLSTPEKKLLDSRLSVAAESIRSYVQFLKHLKDNLNDDNSRSFRIGKDLYSEKFEYDLSSGYTADEMYSIAMERKTEIQQKMGAIARRLWPVYFVDTPMPDEEREMIRKVIDKISLHHVQPDSFMVAIRKQIPELEQFVKSKNLIYLDPSKPLVVRKTPEYMEGGGAGASISAPGPFEAGGNTYYNVSPLTGYSEEAAESYLREYNDYTLQILNIHEAIPGHYAQLVYANQAPSIIKSILENGAMVEGWAVYAERMMLEEGYGGNTPEMWLMYYKWHLRSVCNTILDYSVHVLNWPEKVAMKFLTDEAFQQQSEAEGKWRRVKLTQVQLCSYFTGYTEIYNLREELKRKKGPDFNLKAFHEKFLSYGSAPVKYIRELMLKDF